MAGAQNAALQQNQNAIKGCVQGAAGDELPGVLLLSCRTIDLGGVPRTPAQNTRREKSTGIPKPAASKRCLVPVKAVGVFRLGAGRRQSPVDPCEPASRPAARRKPS